MKNQSRMSSFFVGLFVLSGLMLLTGCGDKAKTKENSTSNDAVAETPSKPEAKTITITEVDVKGFANELAKHKGNVVLVDFWANWCINCKKSFPHTMKLYQSEKGNGLDIISFCLGQPEEGGDSKEDQKKQAIEFLTSQKATFTNFITYSESAYDDFEIDPEGTPPGGIPYYKLYGRNGKLIRTFTAKDGAEKIEAAVKKALAEK